MDEQLGDGLMVLVEHLRTAGIPHSASVELIKQAHALGHRDGRAESSALIQSTIDSYADRESQMISSLVAGVMMALDVETITIDPTRLSLVWGGSELHSSLDDVTGEVTYTLVSTKEGRH